LRAALRGARHRRGADRRPEALPSRVQQPRARRAGRARCQGPARPGLVLAGDFTDRGPAEGFEKAWEFVSEGRTVARMTRREWLQRVVGTGLAALATRAPLAAASARRDLIRAENDKPGTTDWLLTKSRVDPKTKYRCPWVEGYASHTS